MSVLTVFKVFQESHDHAKQNTRVMVWISIGMQHNCC